MKDVSWDVLKFYIHFNSYIKIRNKMSLTIKLRYRKNSSMLCDIRRSALHRIVIILCLSLCA